MKYYKVLYRDIDGKLLSVGAAFGYPSELVLKYAPDKATTAPEGTKLFIFDSYTNARRFMVLSKLTPNNWAEIWEVEAKPVKSVKAVLSVVHLDNWNQPSKRDRKRLLAYWRCILRDTSYTLLIKTTQAPIGTLVCNAVILRRKIT